ncbi:hypothetical protein PAHAL_3G030200 [Panicum hallii]|uniref:FBD domain-containing protein n=1 Tax=Panicum hallii TaxID=206008 RepID=A0A2T8KGW7_9POAL|nr:hypothetical protein PAHAL_3G030200 [Panicum hallii]
MEQERTPPAMKRARPSPPPQAHAADAEDRLSALDYATLHAILARVPLRDAAATPRSPAAGPARVFATLPRRLLRVITFNRRDFPDEGDEDYCEDPRRWMCALRRINFKYMGLYDDWFFGVFRELCGSGGLLELSITNTKYTECYDLPSPVYACKTLTSLYLSNWRLRVPGRITGLRALRSLRLHGRHEHLEIFNIHKARNIVIRASCLKDLLIYSYRPLCVSVKKASRLDKVRLGFSYSYPEYSWRLQETMDSDEDYSFSEIEEMLDYNKMAKREHRQTDEIRNMVMFLGSLSSAKKLHLSPEFPQDSRYSRSHVPLAAEYWEEQINADCVLNHLSSMTFFIDELFEGHSCGGFCPFLVMNSRVLKKLHIMYYRRQVKPEDADKL